MRRCYITPKFTHNDVITLPINEKSAYLIPKEFYPVKCKIWREIKQSTW
jgi:hypothetical protein